MGRFWLFGPPAMIAIYEAPPERRLNEKTRQ
jgi:hypothetical protein